jgi:membrane-bound lytic murein transglycosylase D
VRSGETLSGIARRYGVTVSQLAAWNDISAQHVLRIGQRLVIRPR